MNPTETRNAIKQLVVKHRFKQAIERLLKWSDESANDWVASESNHLLDELETLPSRDHVLLADRIFALAECVVTGGFPEMGSNGDHPDLTGSASNIEFGGASEVSPEISSMSDHTIEMSEGMAPPIPNFPSATTAQKDTKLVRSTKNNGGFPTTSTEKMPATGSKSKPVFSATPPQAAPAATSPIVSAASFSNEVPPTGFLRCHIPSSMKLNQDNVCSIFLAFDSAQLPDTSSEEGVKTVRISRIMEVKIENEKTEAFFKIVSASEKQQQLSPFEATEWRFSIRPLLSGQQRILLKITTMEVNELGKKTRKTQIWKQIIDSDD